MTVAVVINESCSPAAAVRWAMLFARALEADLLVVEPRVASESADTKELVRDDAGNEGSLLAAVSNTVGDAFVFPGKDSTRDESAEPGDNRDTEETKTVHVLQIRDPEPSAVVIREISAASATLLVIPRAHALRDSSPDLLLEQTLLRRAPCETVQLCAKGGDGLQIKSIVVAAGTASHTGTALKLGRLLGAASGARVEAVYVQPDVDEVAADVGQRTVESVVQRWLGGSGHDVSTRVILAPDIATGLGDIGADECDLMLVSREHDGPLQRLLQGTVPDQLLAADSGPSLGVVRAALPLTSRLRRFLREATVERVPQLDREQRVRLVDRVSASSAWDFDFIALICLSTLIASFGLVQNSAAVVIGAMLVAPLMTPILGMGLSLVQGNRFLARRAAGSVLRGFVLAFGIGLVTGLCVPMPEPTSEMSARGAPGLLDMLVGFISGIAAAYAIGRPNLLSALPGVAIAAALVPPIATSGLAIAAVDVRLAMGAALLFLTNIVAIVLGTAISLRAVGIRDSHEHGTISSWTRRAVFGIVASAIALGTYETMSGPMLSQQLRRDVTAFVEARPNTACESVRLMRDGDGLTLDVTVSAPKRFAEDDVSRLTSLVKKHLEQPAKVRVFTRLMSVSRDDS